MQQDVRLYSQKINPYAEKVACALNYKRVAHERIVSDSPEDIRRWSPVTRQLPVLEWDGKRVWESAEILRFVDERAPDPPLLSPDPSVAASQERFAEWSDTSFVWYWNRWREARFPRPGDEQPANPGLVQKLRDGIERCLGRPSTRLTRGQLREIEVAEELAKRLDDLLRLLGSRPFFHSDQLSVADLSVYGMLRAMRDSAMLGADAALAERPTLIGYMDRVEKLTRPA